ncbi:hypothetical protein J5681_02735 [bacterium]|nr:hypothetical protein [bacterium]
MKNTKFLVLFSIIFAFFVAFAQEEPDQDVPAQDDQDVPAQDDQDVPAQDDQDQEAPDQDTQEPEDPDTGDNYGHMIGGEPAKSWEDGGQDFFVMFNSNIDNKIKLFGEDDANPQGDTCVDSSSFTLNDFHIPEDAIIEEAYLVWMGAVDPAKLNEPTDNEVYLSFVQAADPAVKIEGEEGKITAGETGKKLNAAPSFDFEGIKFKDTVEIGCSETKNGTAEEFELGYFTYRVDVTDFFKKIEEKNREAGYGEDGEYYGTYTFSGLDCTDHDAYKCKTTMVSGWSLFFIYRSKNIKPKKIYFYNGLSFVVGDKSTAKVKGFELPLYPAVRVTTMIAEGDPSLAVQSLPPEGIFLSGQNATGSYKLNNKCNPITSTYVEVFNSVSSIVNWNPDAADDNKIQCVSGPEDEGVNYGMDVDTFLLDSSKEINLQEHLEKGNTEMDIQLSVNQDGIFTNFMVISVDIKGANFDIPDEFDDEKYFCACPASENNGVKDYYCPYSNGSREFYYLVRVQNWGEDETGIVTISDELDPQLDYVAGTTEMATNCRAAKDGDETKRGDTCDDWKEIPDKDGGKFPLSGTGYKLSDKMLTCNKTSCPDKILVRYKVRPKKGIAKNYVFNNTAEIKDELSDEPYKTNKSYPLKLKPGSCVSDSICPNPTPEMCGGVKDDKECGASGLPECPNGYVCENFKCVNNPELMCNDAAVELGLGKNTPQSDNSIIISKNNDGLPLVLGQFTLQASGCDEDKVFNFDAISVHYDTKRDNNFTFSDFELIYDADGNGVYDEAVDSILSSVPENENSDLSYVHFTLKKNAKKYVGKSLNYFLVRAKVDYRSEDIAANTSFHFYLEDGDVRINKEIEGNAATVSNQNLEFATFYLEPTGDFFIITTGSHDPAVPPVSEMNKNIPVMQVRTKSIGKENSVKQFKVKIPSSKFVKFGEKNGITGISLWLDTNNDGLGDIKLAEKTVFESGESTSITLDNFTQAINYSADEEKYFVIYVDFNMAKADPAMVGRIQVPKGGLKLKEESNFYELPLNSKTYTYACQEGDANCETKKKSGGCAVLEVESDNTNILFIAAVVSAAAMLGFALLRKRIF